MKTKNMIVEQRINKELGECTYNTIHTDGRECIWERACKDNNIDFVVGIRRSKKDNPDFMDFDTRKTNNIALRFLERADAAAYYKVITGITI